MHVLCRRLRIEPRQPTGRALLVNELVLLRGGQVPVDVELLALGVGTLAATATCPVDVVTSDRDLFQVVDDSRRVRVVSTARGMRDLELVTDGVLQARYGVRAAQYAEWLELVPVPSQT